MQLVIDIDEYEYKRAKELVLSGLFEYEGTTAHLFKRVANGTPLPKGHGRLIDISKIEEDRTDDDNPIIYLTIDGNYTEAVSLDYLNDLSTIIEADEGE